jgi:hypothetical protein
LGITSGGEVRFSTGGVEFTFAGDIEIGGLMSFWSALLFPKITSTVESNGLIFIIA